MSPSPTHLPSRRHALALLGAGAGAGLLAACGGSDAGSAPTAAPAAGAPAFDGETIRVATFTNNHAAAPLFWPDHAPEGLTVVVQTLGSGTDMNVALENGDLDFALFGLVNGFIQAEEGIGSRIVAMGAEKGAGLVVPADFDGEDVTALAGRRIGWQGPAFQYLLLLELLEDAGLDPDRDVELVAVDWNDMPAALAGGDVDAYMGTEPNPSRSVADGTGRRLVDPYSTPAGSLNSAIWASRTVLDRPDLLRAASAMQVAAAEQLSPGGENDAEQWRALTVDGFGYDEAVYEALLPNVGAVGRFDDTWRGQALAQAERMVALGLLQQVPGDDVFRLDEQV
ncbi:ABC transporter substrate-binding protein [Aquipuribacter nitratireducens]|uniref:ABC transporter substrate-binding protein n=1 Tax=Aquipuribacter nitratireducens TaxID=650104 RepID=A0ABW0GQ73_9MICO